MRWLAALFIFATGLMISAAPAQAWGGSGHQIVCEIAYRNLTTTARAEVDRLLPKFRSFGTFAEACNYPDQPPILGNQHWVNFARDLVAVTNQAGCGVNTGGTCILRSLRRDLAILSNRSGADRTRARALFLIGHWLGDVHQPLHASHGDDSGGGGIRIESGPCLEHVGDMNNLHKVWDRCIIEVHVYLEEMQLDGETSNANRLTRARALAASLDSNPNQAQRRRWLRSAPWQWAGESYVIARRPDVLYCFRRGDSCWYDEDRETSDGSRRIGISAGYLSDHAQDVKDRLLMGGVRLAHVLNAALDTAYRI